MCSISSYSLSEPRVVTCVTIASGSGSGVRWIENPFGGCSLSKLPSDICGCSCAFICNFPMGWLAGFVLLARCETCSFDVGFRVDAVGFDVLNIIRITFH